MHSPVVWGIIIPLVEIEVNLCSKLIVHGQINLCILNKKDTVDTAVLVFDQLFLFII